VAERARWLIQCIGNRLRRDDGAGPVVGDRLRSLGLPARPIRKRGCGTHLFALAEAVELARVLSRLPSLLHLYAIEGRCFGAGEGLTPEVEAAVTLLAEELHAVLTAEPAEPGWVS
jgi:hydrogenase maturation protease